MTPEQLAKSGTEHGEQRALFAWVAVAKRHGFELAWAWADNGTQDVFRQSAYCGEDLVPELEWMHAIPNGGYRDKITAAKLKAEGVKKGIPDVMLPLPMAFQYAGLYIEMKRSKDTTFKRQAGKTSEDQEKAIAYLRSVGYAVSVCFDWRSAAKDVQSYIEAVRQGNRNNVHEASQVLSLQ